MTPEHETEFEEFVAARSTALLRTAYLLVGDLGHAEDLLQVALLRTAKHWGRQVDHPEAYVRRVLVNLSKDRFRWRGRRPRESWHEYQDTDLTMPHAADRIAERDELFQGLRALPQRQRAVLVLRFWEDLTVRETAEVLGCSEGAVKSHTHRAIARMRALLQSQPGAAEATPGVLCGHR